MNNIAKGVGNEAERQATFQLLKEKAKRELQNTVYGLTYKYEKKKMQTSSLFRIANIFLREAVLSSYWTWQQLLDVIDLVDLG